MPRKITQYLIFFFCFVGFLHAQTRGLSGIRGQISAPGLNNLNAIEVLLEKSNQFVGRTFTDASGGFEFQNLEAATYEIIVRLTGYLESRQSVDVESRIDLDA